MSGEAYHAQAVLATIGTISFIPWLLMLLLAFKVDIFEAIIPAALLSVLLLGCVSAIAGMHVYWWLV